MNAVVEAKQLICLMTCHHWLSHHPKNIQKTKKPNLRCSVNTNVNYLVQQRIFIMKMQIKHITFHTKGRTTGTKYCQRCIHNIRQLICTLKNNWISKHLQVSKLSSLRSWPRCNHNATKWDTKYLVWMVVFLVLFVSKSKCYMKRQPPFFKFGWGI